MKIVAVGIHQLVTPAICVSKYKKKELTECKICFFFNILGKISFVIIMFFWIKVFIRNIKLLEFVLSPAQNYTIVRAVLPNTWGNSAQRQYFNISMYILNRTFLDNFFMLTRCPIPSRLSSTNIKACVPL
jgi:hypothetical protein